MQDSVTGDIPQSPHFFISTGQFSEVFKGVLQQRGAESMPVAVKMTKKTISDYLQQEMAIMSQMMHPNIVRLYGIVNEGMFVFLPLLPCLPLCPYLLLCIVNTQLFSNLSTNIMHIYDLYLTKTKRKNQQTLKVFFETKYFNQRAFN